MSVLARLKGWARAIKRDLATLWLAARRRDVPWPAKLVAAATVAYALSPIDLIPDFVPLLGYLDDALIVPAGILLALRLIPKTILVELRLQAEATGRLPASKAGLAFVLLIWVAAALALGAWLFAGR